MTIGIAIAVPDGIALAADSQTTWNSIINKAKDKNTGQEFELAQPISLPIGWSKMARKLFSVEIQNKRFALITAGEAQLNAKTMYAVFKGAATQFAGDDPSFNNILQHFIDSLKNELCIQFNCQINNLSNQQIKACEFIIATYENDDVSKPIVESHLVFSGTLNINGTQNGSGHFRKWTNTNGPSRYGGCWIGRTDFVSHIVIHKNNKLPPIQGQYHMMTLADAVDYTKFLVNFTCDYQRFAIMVPDCGKPIVSATLTPTTYERNVV